MAVWLDWIPRIDRVLAGVLAVSAVAALLTRHRGGRFRALPGWVLFWVAFGGVLVSMSRLQIWVSTGLLGATMFAALRTYFFVAPVRPRDRYAILAAYLFIPFALYPGLTGAIQMFQATVPIILFLLFPVLLSVGSSQEGLLESLGRVLLGVLLFVFCASHLAMIPHLGSTGLLELFAVFVIAAELAQRLIGRFGRGAGWRRPLVAVLVSAVLTVTLGFLCGPMCGLVEEDAARAGLLVTIAATMGALVTEAVVRDLAVGSSSARVGRAVFLDRAIPAVYAAPVFFHYLNTFA